MEVGGRRKVTNLIGQYLVLHTVVLDTILPLLLPTPVPCCEEAWRAQHPRPSLVWHSQRGASDLPSSLLPSSRPLGVAAPAHASRPCAPASWLCAAECVAALSSRPLTPLLRLLLEFRLAPGRGLDAPCSDTNTAQSGTFGRRRSPMSGQSQGGYGAQQGPNGGPGECPPSVRPRVLAQSRSAVLAPRGEGSLARPAGRLRLQPCPNRVLKALARRALPRRLASGLEAGTDPSLARCAGNMHVGLQYNLPGRRCVPSALQRGLAC